MKHLFNDIFVLSRETSNGNPLLWREDLGIGYLKSNGMSYDDEYWENYHKYASSPINLDLTAARVSFLTKWVLPTHRDGCWNHVCDVGIGNGSFVEMLTCKGTDVNPRAIEWLQARNQLATDLTKFDALTFWDVLEHVDDPSEVLLADQIFVSLPIHADLEACLKSKHLKPNEHIWHFTRSGFVTFMEMYNYRLVDWNDDESRIGRESIESFYFEKKKATCGNCGSCKCDK